VPVGSSSKPAEETIEQHTKQLVEKLKESRHAKVLQKDKVEGLPTPFCFYDFAMLANIPARITLYGLLKLSKSTRKALREVLAYSEAFIAHILTEHEEEFVHVVACLSLNSRIYFY